MKNVTNHAVIRYIQRFLNIHYIKTNEDLSKFCQDLNNKKLVNVIKTKILRFSERAFKIDNHGNIDVFYNKEEDIIFIVNHNRILSVYRADGISYKKDLLNAIYLGGIDENPSYST